jgi:diguanylate cyclase (GGDEF)-like protein/PAS domain S-box-containing protein
MARGRLLAGPREPPAAWRKLQKAAASIPGSVPVDGSSLCCAAARRPLGQVLLAACLHWRICAARVVLFRGSAAACGAMIRKATIGSMPSSRLFASLKFRIVAVAVLAGLMSALGTAMFVLNATESEIQRMLLDNDRQDRERTALLLSDKLETLKKSLAAVARHAGSHLWLDQEGMERYLLDLPALGVLFDTVFATTADGSMIALIDHGRPGAVLPNIGDRDYFQLAMQSDQPVVSEPLLSKVGHEPMIVVAVSVQRPDGLPRGLVAGAIRLHSNSLFSDPIGSSEGDVREMVMDRRGKLLSHTDPQRTLGNAQQEPGFGEVFGRWQSSGSPIDTQASARMSEGHLVSMAGIPLSDWTLVRLTPRSRALAPMDQARRAAWLATLGAGALAGLLAGLVAWATVRPIAMLRNRAQRMLEAGDACGEAWPHGEGEIGAMSQAFQLLLRQREMQRETAQDLLHQLHAVLDNAEVGIALSRNGRFEIVSRQFCSTFQYEREQAVGQPTRMIYPSDEAYAALSARAEPAFLQHGLFDGKVELMRRNGELFWAHMRGRAVVPGDRTQGTIWVIADVTQAHRQHEQLSWAASHDKLTGLSNRAAFEVLLEEATSRAATQPFCTLFIDLDRFKAVNDLGGHAAGDALLREIAGRLSLMLRSGDTVARLGGDEFAVLLPTCPIPQAAALAERLRQAVEDYRLDWDGVQHSVGASIGLVAVNGRHATAADVLKAADAACYQAKRQGRNSVAVAPG